MVVTPGFGPGNEGSSPSPAVNLSAVIAHEERKKYSL